MAVRPHLFGVRFHLPSATEDTYGTFARIKYSLLELNFVMIPEAAHQPSEPLLFPTFGFLLLASLPGIRKHTSLFSLSSENTA